MIPLFNSPSSKAYLVFKNSKDHYYYYFSVYQASPRVTVDDYLVAKLADTLNHEDPTPEIFDDIQRKVLYTTFIIRPFLKRNVSFYMYVISFVKRYCKL